LRLLTSALSTIAMIIAIFSNRIGFVFATVVAFIAFFCSMIAMAVDLSLFGQMKSKMNVYDELVASTKYGAATWVTVVATVLLLFATCASVFETCRRRRADRW
jgi:hypothetical protein